MIDWSKKSLGRTAQIDKSKPWQKDKFRPGRLPRTVTRCRPAQAKVRRKETKLEAARANQQLLCYTFQPEKHWRLPLSALAHISLTRRAIATTLLLAPCLTAPRRFDRVLDFIYEIVPLHIFIKCLAYRTQERSWGLSLLPDTRF